MRMIQMALYVVCYAALVILSALALPFSEKFRNLWWGHVGAKRRFLKRAATLKNCVWFHVASSGELEQCLPVVDAAREDGFPVVISYFSPSAERAIRLEGERRAQLGKEVPWEYADYSPLDFPFTWGKILDAVNPRAVFMVQKELWPGLLLTCEAKAIPRFLLASFFPEKLQAHPRKYLSLLRHLSAVSTYDPKTQAWFNAHFPELPCTMAADPRIERVLGRRKMQSEERAAKGLVFLAASIWPEDFAVISKALKLLSEEGALPQVVLVPHEPRAEFVMELEEWFRSQAMEVYTGAEIQTGRHQIVNTVGKLAELYQCASFVFVGGSFKARVHNVLEPAAYGCPVVTGPRIQNSKEALEMSKGHGLSIARNAEELQQQLAKWLSSEVFLQEESLRIEKYLLDRTGGGRANWNWFLKRLDPAQKRVEPVRQSFYVLNPQAPSS